MRTNRATIEDIEFFIWSLLSTGGDTPKFKRVYYDGKKKRIGQAFYNSLSGADKVSVAGTIADPFHRIEPSDIYKAIEFLLDHSPTWNADKDSKEGFDD